ncbi:endolytic transglycosylase MltG [Bacillus kwashiorkori]|uniref:endolytic transglycosylase MltG n=1 Tax=Bacillus kwashiorkori TaxID=1522318 RepID=UPI000782BEA9|nr:endolytic transglycosylase MltG [Bacillus kwashiorkori]
MEKDKKLSKQEILLAKQKEAKIVRKIVFPVSIVLFLLFTGIATGGYLYITSSLKPLDPSNKADKEIEIPLGSGITSIANMLEKQKIIKDAKIFKYYVKFKNESGFQAGTYQLSPSMTFDEIIANLKTGKVLKDVAIRIPVPEGLSLKEISAIIARETSYSVNDVDALLADANFIKELKEQYPTIFTDEIDNELIKHRLEGYLFPATYTFTEEKPDLKKIIKSMVAKTESVILKYLPDMKSKEMTVHQLLTLASLIEEEAADEESRKTIASVFYNRMDIGMPLQTDPSVLYAMQTHKDRLYFKDYEYDDPYNTYKNLNLPPGPIANAGVSSIEAALYPIKSDYLYFLATKEGETLFSKTFKEHNEKYNKYIAQ